MAPQREWFDTDYYKVLGVDKGATDKEITRAYRRLAKQFHPDANPGSEERFKEISAAYDVLGDPDRRKEYDEVRRLSPTGGHFGAAGGQPGDFSFRVDDISDLFGGLFRNQGSGSSRRGQGPQRGADLEADLHLSFDEAVEGAITSVNVATHETCSVCHGSGARPGTQTVVCPSCGGTGVLNDNQGLFSLSSPCPECRGRGTKIVDPCPHCFGTGVERRNRSVKVRIPAGVDDKQRIRVKGRGEPGRNGGPSGDLFVNVSVAPHKVFGRRGQDLTLTVPVTFPELALGAQLTVPNLNSRAVTLKIPPGTKSGATFRVRGRGITRRDQKGDLLVTVEVVVPTELSEAQKEAIKGVRDAQDLDPRAHLGVTP